MNLMNLFQAPYVRARESDESENVHEVHEVHGILRREMKKQARLYGQESQQPPAGLHACQRWPRTAEHQELVRAAIEAFRTRPQSVSWDTSVQGKGKKSRPEAT